jgi:hypothetical protein
MKFFLEEDVFWQEDEYGEYWDWVYGRQEKFHMIRSPAEDMDMKAQVL